MVHSHETELLERARNGSVDALNTLYQRCAARLLALIRVRLGPQLRSRLDSRDILQATLLKSVQHFDDLQASGSASLMAWLARIAEREIRDQADFQNRQRRDARRDVPIEDAAEGLAAHARSALSQVVLDERARQLEAALDALEAGYREVILLRNYEELSFREIGVRMGRSEDACRMLYGRAMAALTLKMRERV